MVVATVVLIHISAKTSMAFPPCRAATAFQLAVSSMSATAATGGVLARAIATTLTTGTCTTAARAQATTTTIRAACSVFVACRIERFYAPLLAKQAQCTSVCRKTGGVDEKNLRQWWCGCQAVCFSIRKLLK